MRRFRRLGWAGLVSLALHMALLALVWDSTPPRPPPAPPAPRDALLVELVTVPKAAPASAPPLPEVQRRPRPAAPAPPPVSARAAREAPALAASAPEEPPSSPTAAPEGASMSAPPAPTAPEPPAPPAVAGSPAPAPDAPRPGADVPRLAPSLLPGSPALAGPPSPTGRTLRPGDPSLSPGVLLAEERARVGARVERFVEDQQAHLRVANGLIDPYFSRLREALEKGLDGAPVFEGTSGTLANAVTSWGDQAERFGATGNPGTGPAPAAPTVSEQLSGLQQRARDKGTEAAVEGLRARAQAGEEVQKLAGGGGNKLVVTLELRQAPDGTVREVKLVSPSGNKAYDAYVLAAVPGSLAKLAPPPEGARGVRADGIHTLWEVEGRVVYLRKLKDLKGQDTWYLAAAAAAGVLAGRFEETTGEVEVIDFRNPRFVLKPRLLRVY